jgi:Zn-dependent protease with chaperone function
VTFAERVDAPQNIRRSGLALVEDKFGVLPVLRPDQKLDLRGIRDRWENFYLVIIYAFDCLVALALFGVALWDLETFFIALIILGIFGIISWISWHFLRIYIYGNSIEVGPTQYPQIYRTVKRAADLLEVATPTIVIIQGHGMFELFIARRFSRRGLVIITSNMIDEFSKRPSSRELMMFVGRQLGHIKAKHFHRWILKDSIGRFAFFFYYAWKRRCNFTADRVGLLVTGEIEAAERALYMITVGGGIAPSTNFDDVKEQRARLFESPWSWFRLAFASYPYIVDRVVRLHQFSEEVARRVRPEVGAIPVDFFPVRSLPLLIIHGHDQLAVLDLKDFLYSAFPHVVPRQMMLETAGSLSMPEKFESTVWGTEGAIALLTPDDTGAAASTEGSSQPRARQNVIMEVGWAWGKLGRDRFLLLIRGDIEIPSDLSGVDVYRFTNLPRECSEAVRTFVHKVAL